MEDRKTVAPKKKDGFIETFKTVALLLSLSPFLPFFFIFYLKIFISLIHLFLLQKAVYTKGGWK